MERERAKNKIGQLKASTQTLTGQFKTKKTKFYKEKDEKN
jgi:hypothetical protein